MNGAKNPIKYLPKETREVLQPGLVDNLSLICNRMYFDMKPSRYDPKDEFPHYLKTQREIIKHYSERYEYVVRKRFPNVKQLRLKLSSRLAVGLGNESIYETSLTLHHIYGIPYIPGSAVKGSTRNWIILNLFNASEETAIEDEGFRRVFGFQSNKGSNKGEIVFLDAYPLGSCPVELDVMTPHYGDYYNGQAPPADYLSPNPIKFLVVKAGQDFKFFLTSDNDGTNPIKTGKFSGNHPIDVAEEWLIKSATESGIGAKTAVGYGVFTQT